MRTYEEQQQLIAEKHQQEIQDLEEYNSNCEEYFTRIFHWKLDYRGRFHVPTSLGFNPNHWVGTEFEYDKIFIKHLNGKEDEFKIIGVHRFNSYEDLEDKFSIKKYNLI